MNMKISEQKIWWEKSCLLHNRTCSWAWVPSWQGMCSKPNPKNQIPDVQPITLLPFSQSGIILYFQSFCLHSHFLFINSILRVTSTVISSQKMLCWPCQDTLSLQILACAKRLTSNHSAGIHAWDFYQDMKIGITTGTFCGTLSFMAPEMLLYKTYNASVDW